MGRSILDDLGQEVTGIVSPVTICMAVTVLLVRALNPDGTSNPSAVAIAQTYYREKASDPPGVKFEGAVINSLIFVAIVGVMTFVLFLLFKYGCESCIWGYMGFAAFQILFLVLGTIVIQLVQLQPLPIDLFSFLFVLWNFAVVGTATMFMWPAPVVMKQCYMIIIGVLMAYIFSSIPEWTTWILLMAMALYDVIAVLTPNGPLKLLVELAQERDAQIPALVYEARSTGQGGGRQSNTRVQSNSTNSINQADVARLPVSTVVMAHGSQPNNTTRQRFQEEIEMTDSSQDTPTEREEEEMPANIALPEERSSQQEVEKNVAVAGLGFVEADTHRTVHRTDPSNSWRDLDHDHDANEEEHLLENPGSSSSHRLSRNEIEAPSSIRVTRDDPQEQAAAPHRGQQEDDMHLPDGIKLGLGDFIFYSVLVGRAAMYDWLTVFACYLAIVAGLGATLICLALYQAALPALPISITLGVVFYFIARLVIEPVLLPMSMHLLYF